jgi:hypothetical protein
MLNKTQFFTAIAILFILTVFSYFFYNSNKQNAFYENKRYTKLKNKIEYVNYLKHYFKTPKLHCVSKKREGKIIYICKNLNKNKIASIENKIFNNYVNINSFDIVSNGKKADFEVEINK